MLSGIFLSHETTFGNILLQNVSLYNTKRSKVENKGHAFVQRITFYILQTHITIPNGGLMSPPHLNLSIY
jgi:hypothetical protein